MNEQMSERGEFEIKYSNSGYWVLIHLRPSISQMLIHSVTKEPQPKRSRITSGIIPCSPVDLIAFSFIFCS